MNKIKTALLLALFAISLTGCGEEDERGEVQTTQQAKQDVNYHVTFLFEVDGIRVYRFYDDWHYVYFTNANGHAEYFHTRRTGKTVTTTRIQSVNSSTQDHDCTCLEKGEKHTEYER